MEKKGEIRVCTYIGVNMCIGDICADTAHVKSICTHIVLSLHYER